MRKPKVALIYDRVNKFGGAERILLTLNQLFPDAPLYTSVYSPKETPWAEVFPKINSSFLQSLPYLNKHHELLGALTPIAFETFDFSSYDLVISVTSEAAKGIITKPQTSHICICLTPTRYLWSGFEEYRQNSPEPFKSIPFYKSLSLPFLKYLKKWDLVASQRPDVYIAISGEVKNRIKKFYNRDSVVIYPPVEVDRFKNVDSRSKNKREYYLVVSRLVPYKKVDLVIKTFNDLKLPLVIVGTGSEEQYLRRIAHKNISFLGFVPDDDLPKIYAKAIAFINPQDEDFGIAAVEAQATGVPVIAYKKGGALDTVIDGKTGILFDIQSKDFLTSAINKFGGTKFDKQALTHHAEQFSNEVFKIKFDNLMKKYDK